MIESSLVREFMAEARTEGEANGKAEGKAEGMAEGMAQGKAQGKAQGRLAAERELCLAMVREYHPALEDRLRGPVQTCADPEALKAWILRIPRATSVELTRLVTRDRPRVRPRAPRARRS